MGQFKLLVTGHTDPVPGAMDSAKNSRCVFEMNLRGGPLAAYVDTVELFDPEDMPTLLMEISNNPSLIESFVASNPENSRRIHAAFEAFLHMTSLDTAPLFSDVNGHGVGVSPAHQHDLDAYHADLRKEFGHLDSTSAEAQGG